MPETDRFEVHVWCLPDAGSRTYVDDLAKIFDDNKWKITANCLFNQLRPDFVGLSIGISPVLKGKQITEFPKNIQTLVQVINAARLDAQWSLNNEGTKEDEFYLIVGNAP